jgi:hypothetical protein
MIKMLVEILNKEMGLQVTTRILLPLLETGMSVFASTGIFHLLGNAKNKFTE